MQYGVDLAVRAPRMLCWLVLRADDSLRTSAKVQSSLDLAQAEDSCQSYRRHELFHGLSGWSGEGDRGGREGVGARLVVSICVSRFVSMVTR